jgi:threonine synthase
MEISNDDLARILGRMEAKLDQQASTSLRVENSLTNLDTKVTRQFAEHDQRLRELEVANPKRLAESVKGHEERIQALEKGAAKAGVVAGVGSSLAMAALIELVKHKLGL